MCVPWRYVPYVIRKCCIFTLQWVAYTNLFAEIQSDAMCNNRFTELYSYVMCESICCKHLI
jgi:hypothetical protein